jgi:four helix bundle protein
MTALCAAAARTPTDFIAKLGGALEEADEAGYWLEVLVEAAITTSNVAGPLLREADELTRIFVASRETARRNARTRRKKSRIMNHES